MATEGHEGGVVPNAPLPVAGADRPAVLLERLCFAIGIAVVGYHVAPMWSEVQTWGGTRDWGYFFFLAEVDRKTLLEFGQFPLWNPYYCGGAVHLANPQTYFLSATFPFILAFGAALGIRLTITGALFFGFEGVRRLARAVGIHPVGAIVAGTGFAVSGAMAQHLGGGHVGWVGFAVLPWVLVSVHRALDGRRPAIVYGALFLFWILGHFGVYPYPYAVITLGVYALAVGIAQRKVLKAIAFSAAMVVLSVLLGAVRLLPLLDFIKDHPRTVSDADFLEFPELWEVYVARHTLRDWGHQWVWPEYGNYFGPIGLALFLFGVVAIALPARRRLGIPVLVGVIVFVLFQCGNAPGLPWWGLKQLHLPIIENLRVPSRFTTVVGIFACVVIGFGVDLAIGWLSKLKAPTARLAALAAVALVGFAYTADAAQFNRQQWGQTFGTPVPTDAVQPDFRQALGDPNRMYLYPRTNQGSLMCFEESPLDISQALRVNLPQEEFPGNAQMGTVKRLSWSPNKVVVETDFPNGGIVVVNQNFERHWSASGGEVMNVQGLLAAKVAPGKHEVSFRYLPAPFLKGLFVTLAALAFSVFFAWRFRQEGR